MSQTATLPTAIPTAVDVQMNTGGATWRFQKGKIVTGRETDGTQVEREGGAVIGLLRRVGIHDGKTNDEYKRPIKQVECDIETADGMVYLKAGLLKRETGELSVNRSAVDFAWGLTQTAQDELIMVSAAQGEPWKHPVTGVEMSPSTYVNFARLEPDAKNPGRFVGRPKIKPKKDPKAPKVEMNDQWLALEPLIRAHSAFGPRPNARADDDEHDDTNGGQGYAEPDYYTKLLVLCKNKEWPGPDVATPEWLTLMAAALYGREGKPKTGLLDHTKEEWKAIYEALEQRAQIPGVLAGAKARLEEEAKARAAGPAVMRAADYDPFA